MAKKNLYELCTEEFDGQEWFRGLTVRQAAFVREYLKCFNATEAAIQAGYGGKRKSQVNIGSRNLEKPKILRALRRAVLQMGIQLPELAETLREEQQAALHRFYNEQGLNLLTYEEQDRWQQEMQAYLARKKGWKPPKGPVKPQKWGDPYLEELKRMYWDDREGR